MRVSTNKPSAAKRSNEIEKQIRWIREPNNYLCYKAKQCTNARWSWRIYIFMFLLKFVWLLFSSYFLLFVNSARYVAISPFFYVFKIFIKNIFSFIFKYQQKCVCLCVSCVRSRQTHCESCFALSCRRSTAFNAENEYFGKLNVAKVDVFKCGVAYEWPFSLLLIFEAVFVNFALAFFSNRILILFNMT